MGKWPNLCSQIVLKCLFLARTGRPDILWPLNKLARAVTKWIGACDRRLARLLSKSHQRSEFRQKCHEGKPAEQCRLGLFEDSDFAGDIDDSQSTSGRILCIFGGRTLFRSVECARSKRRSHSSNTVPQSLRSHPWTLVYTWTASPPFF